MDSQTKTELEELIRTTRSTIRDALANGWNQHKMRKAADNLSHALGMLDEME